ncbi:MAG: hypothetical protein ABEI52_09035, partial [Halobacteriaceae archaeon]
NELRPRRIAGISRAEAIVSPSMPRNILLCLFGTYGRSMKPGERTAFEEVHDDSSTDQAV